jgi:hypothetical protein
VPRDEKATRRLSGDPHLKDTNRAHFRGHCQTFAASDLANTPGRVLLAVPDQRKWVLGAEYLILAFVVTGAAVMVDWRAGSQRGSVIGRRLDAINPTVVTCSLLVIAAVVLMLGHKDGIYVLVPTLIAVLVGGVVNAWLILVGLTG